MNVALSLLMPLDLAALAIVGVAWVGIGLWIETPGMRRRSVTVIMADYRREWMVQFLKREVRIFDSQILGNLRQGTTFFASTSLFAVGGVLALIGNVSPLEGVTEGLTQTRAPELLLQMKLMLVALFLSHAFLKFVWSNRIFGYCAVVMASVPNDPADAMATTRAGQAAELNIRAAWNFNRGLRSMYFALGALGWLVGAVPLMVATVAVVWLLWSREFASVPRDILLKVGP